ncbi:hypothetical protein SHAb15599_00062 [Acinetobacter phage SH-Ab 15599]|nr:hypothetical protein SHAb15599_00062 [Acinetobacter phage SH-Ab 15599]
MIRLPDSMYNRYYNVKYIVFIKSRKETSLSPFKVCWIIFDQVFNN